MLVKLSYKNCEPKLILQYEGDEWQKVEKILQDLGLEVAETSNLWGKGLRARFYRENDTELKNMLDKYLSNGNSYSDNINTAFYEYGYVNLAVFRIIPTNNIVEIKLNRLLSILELKNIVEQIQVVLEKLFNIALEVEVKIVRKENKEVKND